MTDTVISPEDAGWTYSGLRVVELGAGQELTLQTGDAEMLVLPLAGACSVAIGEVSIGEVATGEVTFELQGRRDVFSRVTDFAYAPRDSTVVISTVAGGRFALPSARCEKRLAPRYGPAEQVPVELRGAGQAARQVNNFCTPEAFPYADKLIACEVLTPGGNWSSYPPHKHDEERPGEAVLEEIYYFEVAAGGMGYQRVYGTEDRPIDILEEVRSGDTVLIPHGWHGPSMAAPGYDLYYLNVMAGPADDRAWLICDDPAHSWVRDTWADLPADPRLPMTSVHGREGAR